MPYKKTNLQLKNILLFLLFSLSFFGFTAQATEVKLKYIGGLGSPDTRGGMIVDDKYIWVFAHKNDLWRVDRCTDDSVGPTTGDDSQSGDLWWYDDDNVNNLQNSYLSSADDVVIERNL